MAETVLSTATHQEIYQQPLLWPLTLALVEGTRAAEEWKGVPAVITGAGTSAYAAAAIARGWPNAQAIATTDLLVDVSRVPERTEVVVSIARSGDSPESAAVVENVRARFPLIRHVAITCNGSGRLARADGIRAIVLDPRTNDKSLVMTSSFSNLALAGLAMQNFEALAAALPTISRRVEQMLPELERQAREVAERKPSRAVVLASPGLFALAREATLKILEMTGGRCAAIAETFLGLRHGPMSFLTPDSLVVCVLSSEARVRRYEMDLVAEVRAKRLGYVVGMGADRLEAAQFDHAIAASAPDLEDALRTPFEVVFAQLLAYHLSLGAGLNPDNPSPEGVITRVVGGVRIHEG